MPSKFEINAKVTGAGQSADDLKKIGDAAQQSGGKIEKGGEQTDKAASKNSKLLEGLKKLKHEIPIVGTAVDALKNPFTLLSFAVGAAAVKIGQLIEASGQMVSNLGHADKKVEISAGKFSDAAAALAAMAAAMKDLRDFTKNVTDNLDDQIARIDEQFDATEKLVEAESTLAKLRIDRDEPDPVKAAKAKAAIDDELALRKLGNSGRKGQQAAILDRQINAERDLQAEAGAAIPSRDSLVAAVTTFGTDRKNLEDAAQRNRQTFARRELLLRASRDDASPFDFSRQDHEYLSEIGVIGENSVIDRSLAKKLLPAEEANVALSRDRLGRAQSAFNSSAGSLPAGIARLEDIDPFLQKAQAEAAGVQNESYFRAEKLGLRRDTLLRGQQTEIAVNKLGLQSTAVRSDLSVRDAEAAADKAAAVFEKLANRLGRRLDAVERRGSSQSQQ